MLTSKTSQLHTLHESTEAFKLVQLASLPYHNCVSLLKFTEAEIDILCSLNCSRTLLEHLSGKSCRYRCSNPAYARSCSHGVNFCVGAGRRKHAMLRCAHELAHLVA